MVETKEGKRRFLTCQKCGHTWANKRVRGVYREPKICPNPECKSLNWKAD